MPAAPKTVFVNGHLAAKHTGCAKSTLRHASGKIMALQFIVRLSVQAYRRRRIYSQSTDLFSGQQADCSQSSFIASMMGKVLTSFWIHIL
jgi:hypothetical protein